MTAHTVMLDTLCTVARQARGACLYLQAMLLLAWSGRVACIDAAMVSGTHLTYALSLRASDSSSCWLSTSARN